MIVLGKKEFLFLFDSKKILIDGWLLWLGKMEMANSGVVQQEGYLLIQRKALVYYFKPGVHLQLAVVCVYACMYVCLFVFPHPREQTFYLKLESSLYTNDKG